MIRAYAQAVRPKMFTEGQLVLRMVEHVSRNLPGPSKFTPKWEGPYIIRVAHESGYYYLTKEDGTIQRTLPWSSSGSLKPKVARLPCLPVIPNVPRISQFFSFLPQDQPSHLLYFPQHQLFSSFLA